MSLIGLPESWQAMRSWTEAFTAHLECQAMARSDRQMRNDLSRRAVGANKDAAVSGGDRTAYHIAANQQQVLNTMEQFDPEVHRELMSVWDRVRRDFNASGWNLAEEIEVSELVTREKYLFFQGNPLTGLTLTGRTAQMALMFLLFIRDTSSRMDPNAFVRESLIQQGITNSAEFIASGMAQMGMADPFAPITVAP